MKILTQTGLTELVTKIKSWARTNFFQKSASELSRVLSIDSTPTLNSTNLVSSGGVKTALNAKQDTLTSQTAYTSVGSATQVPQITTNSLGQVTGITEVTITPAFDSVTGRPTYNGATITSSTNIPEVKTSTWDGKQDALSTAQLNAVNSGITSDKVSTYDGYATSKQDTLTFTYNPDDAIEKINSKPLAATYDSQNNDITTTYQTKLDAQTAYTSKGSATKVPQITTNALGQVTGITEVDITQPTVNNASLTLQVNGTTKTTFYANDSTDRTFNITASDLGLSSAMKFVGVSTTDPKVDGATVSGHTTWTKGEVVIYKRTGATAYEEYINIDGNNTASSWELLGDADSYVKKGTVSTSASPTTDSQGAHTHTVTIPKVTSTASKLDLVSVTPAVSNGQATKTVFGTATTASKVTTTSVTASKASAGEAITYGNANAGEAVTVATGLAGTTSFNTDAIKSAELGGTTSFNTDAIKSASLTGTTTFATAGTIVSYDSTTSALVITTASTGSVGITTTAATKASVTLTTTAASKASVSASTTTVVPAVTSTTTLTPYTFTDVTASSVSASDVSVPVVSSNTTVDVAKAGTAVSVADGTVSADGTGSDIVTGVSVTTETSSASSEAGAHTHTVNAHTHTVN